MLLAYFYILMKMVLKLFYYSLLTIALRASINKIVNMNLDLTIYNIIFIFYIYIYLYAKYYRK